MEQHRLQFHKHEESGDKCYNMYILLIKHVISIGHITCMVEIWQLFLP